MDPDEGLNGEIRYEILGEHDESKFTIDLMTGQVRTSASFFNDTGKVFRFDVKAMDRQGASYGRSSIVNVFVSNCSKISMYRRNS